MKHARGARRLVCGFCFGFSRGAATSRHSTGQGATHPTSTCAPVINEAVGTAESLVFVFDAFQPFKILLKITQSPRTRLAP